MVQATVDGWRVERRKGEEMNDAALGRLGPNLESIDLTERPPMRRGVDCRIRHTHPRTIIRLQSSIRHGHATEELINDWVQTTCRQVPHVRGLKWFILCGCSMEMMNGCEAQVARREKHRRYCSWLNGSWINYTYIGTNDFATSTEYHRT